MSIALFVIMGAIVASMMAIVVSEGWAKLAGLARGWPEAGDGWAFVPVLFSVGFVVFLAAVWGIKAGWLY